MIARSRFDHLSMKVNGRKIANLQNARRGKISNPSVCQHRKHQYYLYGAKVIQKVSSPQRKIVQFCTVTVRFSKRRIAPIIFELPENTTTKRTAQVNETTNKSKAIFDVTESTAWKRWEVTSYS